MAFGATASQAKEILAYDDRGFGVPDPRLRSAPLPDEPFVDCWRRWAREAEGNGAYAVLRRCLPQLAFPIRDGISDTETYRAATLRGLDTESIDQASGLELERPGEVELKLHPSFAGTVPVLVARHRPDFERLVQALARRNEPVPVPPSQGAVTVAGYNNWSRVHALRAEWASTAPDSREPSTWARAFAEIRRDKSRFQDRFIILSDGPYSNVSATALDLDDDTWRRTSLEIRRAHECAHYYTRRVYRSMRNHLADELIADYVGITAATGRFRASWFLHFVGLEDPSRYRAGARLDLYRGDPPLGDGAFHVLGHLVRAIVRNLESWDRQTFDVETRGAADHARAIRSLAALDLVELAGSGGVERLARAWAATAEDVKDAAGRSA